MPHTPAPDLIQPDRVLVTVPQPQEARRNSISTAVFKLKRQVRRLTNRSEGALHHVMARRISQTRRLDIKARRLFKHEKTSTTKLEKAQKKNKLKLVAVKSRVDGHEDGAA